MSFHICFFTHSKKRVQLVFGHFTNKAVAILIIPTHREPPFTTWVQCCWVETKRYARERLFLPIHIPVGVTKPSWRPRVWVPFASQGSVHPFHSLVGLDGWKANPVPPVLFLLRVVEARDKIVFFRTLKNYLNMKHIIIVIIPIFQWVHYLNEVEKS